MIRFEITKRHGNDKTLIKYISVFVTYNKHHVQFMFGTCSVESVCMGAIVAANHIFMLRHR